MVSRTLCAIGVGGFLLFAIVATVQSETRTVLDPSAGPSGPGNGGGPAVTPDKHQLKQAFLAANPGVRLSEREGRITRVYGRAFSQGAGAQQSADAFRQEQSGIFGVPSEDLVAIGPFPDGRHVQPIMYQRETDTYKFTGYFYTQQRDGVPVFRSELNLLVRNEPGFPLVLASAQLHDLGDFQVNANAAIQFVPASAQAALDRAAQLSELAGQPEVFSSRKVIWPGADKEPAQPVLADEFVVSVDVDKWLVLTDAQTGAVLYQEQMIHFVDVSGTIDGLSTTGDGAEQCDAEVSMPMPYLYVEVVGGNSTFTDANGDFTISNAGTADVDVFSQLNGVWFDVMHFTGTNDTETLTGVTPPGPADITYNSANSDETVRGQTNAYVHANIIRDFVLLSNAAYPTLNLGNFPVETNRIDGFCPGNAWYDPGIQSINFCLSGAGHPNTAWSSVVYHEYGHHLVNAGGSGQGEYGEGMGDVMSVLILDSPYVGVGFFGPCDNASSLRTADNACVYQPVGCSSCGSAIHTCGQIISGAVWETRNELVITEPVNYTSILADLAINSILLHSGSSITPDIAIDYLTLDDTDADLCNGTPHSSEIGTGFMAKGLFEESLDFDFPNGLPTLIDPAGGTTVEVDIVCQTVGADPGTGVLHVDTAAGFVAYPMTEGPSNHYVGTFPASTCGNSVPFYFSVKTVTNNDVTSPPGAPVTSYNASSGNSLVTVFEDDFQSDMGWTVNSTATDGIWERADPTLDAFCARGSPPTDADGSGLCYVTNMDTLDCNSDVDGGTTTLTSPNLDASDPDSTISYSRWLDNTLGSAPNEDRLLVEVSDDGGSSWTSLDTAGPATENAGGWFDKSFKVSDFVSNTNQFRVRFIAEDVISGSIVEAGVDGVKIETIQCTGAPCPWDCEDTPNGFVDIGDMFKLFGHWFAPGPCDFDGNSQGDINDLFAMFGNWGTCP